MDQNNRYENHGLRQDMNDIREKLEDLEESLVHTARHARSQAKEKVDEVNYKTRRTIREHPLESIGIAFGTGLLMGFIATKSFSKNKR